MQSFCGTLITDYTFSSQDGHSLFTRLSEVIRSEQPFSTTFDCFLKHIDCFRLRNMFVSVTLNICLLIGLASVYCLAMPTDGTPIRLCGSRLMEEIEKACTWPGYTNPCMHGQQKSEADFPPVKRDTGKMII